MSYQIHKIDHTISRLPLKLLYITHSSYDKGWHSTQHAHNFIELFYIISGEGAFIVDHEEKQVQKNELIMINAHIQHTEKSSNEKSLEYITLGFDGVSLAHKDQSHINLIHYHDRQIELLGFIQYILSELKQDQPNVSLVAQNILEIILLKLSQYNNLSFNDQPEPQISANILQIKQYIDLNYSDNITLQTLADISHLSKYYISHSFKEEIGQSPIDYLNTQRIENAKILLESTNYSITEIARFTGFSSQSFFSQRFKEFIGQSPSHYRKQHVQSTLL
ncbi:AraC family transcriptional regulator [Dolosigranulum pigrum]|uniref:AraC family transcriptional regulator n=1 Tax=Dolosigranulum pigrum TaxID=29394 RepID=UPI001AD894D6|nr:AraC family transcriptional regulator [Dolosigranulum pigrum]